MGFGREVHDDVRGGDERTGDRGIGDVALDELMPRVVHHALQVFQPSGVGQLVERRDLPVRVSRQRMADEVGPNETGASGDQHIHHRCILASIVRSSARVCPPNAPRKFENVPMPARVNETLKRRSCGTATGCRTPRSCRSDTPRRRRSTARCSTPGYAAAGSCRSQIVVERVGDTDGVVRRVPVG